MMNGENNDPSSTDEGEVQEIVNVVENQVQEQEQPIEQEAQAETQTQTQHENLVPLGVVKEERRKRQEIEGRFEESQKALQEMQRKIEFIERQTNIQMQPRQEQPKRPDMFSDPDGFVNWQEQQIQETRQEMAALRRESQIQNAYLRAESNFGGETLQKAIQQFDEDLKNDPALKVVLERHSDPYSYAVERYKSRQPETYEEQLLNNPQFLAKAIERSQSLAAQNPIIQQANSQRKLPNSVNNMTQGYSKAPSNSGGSNVPW